MNIRMSVLVLMVLKVKNKNYDDQRNKEIITLNLIQRLLKEQKYNFR